MSVSRVVKERLGSYGSRGPSVSVSGVVTRCQGVQGLVHKVPRGSRTKVIVMVVEVLVMFMVLVMVGTGDTAHRQLRE